MLSVDGEGLDPMPEPEPEPEDTLVGPANGRLPLEPELELVLDCASGDVGEGREVGMVSCVGRGPGLDPLAREDEDEEDAGRQTCSPSELSGIGAAHDEQVTVGKRTEARSDSTGRGIASDMLSKR